MPGDSSGQPGSDIFPTTDRLCYTLSDRISNESRLQVYINQLVMVVRRAANQVVGGSNPSGRAIFVL
jgi:hypothetical protein